MSTDGPANRGARQAWRRITHAMSEDPDNEYFADGISEELLNLLAKIPELRVISRSSAFTFKDSDIGIPEIAEQLDVEHVLE